MDPAVLRNPLELARGKPVVPHSYVAVAATLRNDFAFPPTYLPGVLPGRSELRNVSQFPGSISFA
jgi:hypothetical protein